jgi:translation elongation factor EF-4
MEAPLQMLVTNLDYDEFKGRIALGRVNQGTISKSQGIEMGIPGGASRKGKIGEVFVYQNFIKTVVDSVGAGDICAVVGPGARAAHGFHRGRGGRRVTHKTSFGKCDEGCFARFVAGPTSRRV